MCNVSGFVDVLTRLGLNTESITFPTPPPTNALVLPSIKRSSKDSPEAKPYVPASIAPCLGKLRIPALANTAVLKKAEGITPTVSAATAAPGLR